MFDSEAQAAARVPGAHLLLYDGVCGLCSRLVQFVLAWDRRRVFDFASLQSAAGREAVERSGKNPEELTSFYVVANYRTPEATVLARSRAALFVVRELGWPWKAAALFGVLPAALLDRLYDLVARYRYRIFGRFDRCLTPRAEYRDRFVDW
jgi:predicted DCC family thiol-disulfide oxidoreductase YuxK